MRIPSERLDAVTTRRLARPVFGRARTFGGVRFVGDFPFRERPGGRMR